MFEFLLELMLELFLPLMFVWPGIGIRWAWHLGEKPLRGLDDDGFANVGLSFLFWAIIIGAWILLCW